MSETSVATNERLRRLVEAGFDTNADVRWFVGPHGFLRWCHQFAQGDVVVPDDIEILFGELDDRLLAVPGPPPSARAAALLRLAADVEAGRTTSVDGSLAASLTGDDSDLGLQMAAAAVADLVEFFRTGVEAHPIHHLSVPIAVSAHSHGEIVQLRVAQRSVGALPFGPDLIDSPFQRWGSEFAHAVDDARQASRLRAAVRLNVLSSRTGLPLDAIDGRSVGLGAAVAFRRISDRNRAAPDPSWVFTGDVRADGKVSSLAPDRRPGGYVEKISAAAGRTLVMPGIDLALVDELLRSADLPAVGVSSVAEVEEAIERHRLGVTAYTQTFTEHARARRRRSIKVGLSAALCLGIAAFALFAWSRAINRTEAATRARAWGASIDFDLADGKRTIEKNEVSNAQYVVCMDERPELCSPPALYDPRSADELLKPVRGLTATQARAFCEWLGADLPTADEFAELLMTFDDHEFPRPRSRLQPSASEARGPTELNNLAFNVSEWTSTRCGPELSNCTPWLRKVDPGNLVVFGRSFAASEVGTVGSPSEALDFRRLENGSSWHPHLNDVGFRCVRRDTE